MGSNGLGLIGYIAFSLSAIPVRLSCMALFVLLLFSPVTSNAEKILKVGVYGNKPTIFSEITVFD